MDSTTPYSPIPSGQRSAVVSEPVGRVRDRTRAFADLLATSPARQLYLARAFVRWAVGLGPERVPGVPIGRGRHLVPRTAPARRRVFTLGVISAGELFDQNAFANDPRSQFTNGVFVNDATWAYPQDIHGYTRGGLVSFITPRLAVRAGVLQLAQRSRRQPRLGPLPVPRRGGRGGAGSAAERGGRRGAAPGVAERGANGIVCPRAGGGDATRSVFGPVLGSDRLGAGAERRARNLRSGPRTLPAPGLEGWRPRAHGLRRGRLERQPGRAGGRRRLGPRKRTPSDSHSPGARSLDRTRAIRRRADPISTWEPQDGEARQNASWKATTRWQPRPGRPSPRAHLKG